VETRPGRIQGRLDAGDTPADDQHGPLHLSMALSRFHFQPPFRACRVSKPPGKPNKLNELNKPNETDPYQASRSSRLKMNISCFCVSSPTWVFSQFKSPQEMAARASEDRW
jgi:hypothetical protein